MNRKTFATDRKNHGIRGSEIMRSSPQDVDLAGGFITVREKYRVKGRRSTRRVLLSNRLVDALMVSLAERDGVSCSARSEDHVAPVDAKGLLNAP